MAGSFFDVLNQEFFRGAIVIFPSKVIRGYYDYGVVTAVDQFTFIVDVLPTEAVCLPDSIDVSFNKNQIFNSAIDHGFLIIHPSILQHSQSVAPRKWKQAILAKALETIRPR